MGTNNMVFFCEPILLMDEQVTPLLLIFEVFKCKRGAISFSKKTYSTLHRNLLLLFR